MDAVYPAAAARARHTAPVTFAEIKEVDEECEESEESAESAGGAGGSEASPALARRRPDVLEERLGRQLAESRRRRALLELSPPPPDPAL